jgi:hypothetical protein
MSIRGFACLAFAFAFALVLGCVDHTRGTKSDDQGQVPVEQRPSWTAEACEAVGRVVGDIGDGRVHRPDFRCEDGRQPVASVPLGIEGAVCCVPGDGRGL